MLDPLNDHGPRCQAAGASLGLCIAPFASVSPAASETLAADDGQEPSARLLLLDKRSRLRLLAWWPAHLRVGRGGALGLIPSTQDASLPPSTTATRSRWRSTQSPFADAGALAATQSALPAIRATTHVEGKAIGSSRRRTPAARPEQARAGPALGVLASGRKRAQRRDASPRRLHGCRSDQLPASGDEQAETASARGTCFRRPACSRPARGDRKPGDQSSGVGTA
jgi:hypothetical protein